MSVTKVIDYEGQNKVAADLQAEDAVKLFIRLCFARMPKQSSRGSSTEKLVEIRCYLRYFINNLISHIEV